MGIRTIIFSTLYLLVSSFAYGQEGFVRLDWQKVSDDTLGLPKFNGCVYSVEGKLPYYAEQINLGRAYASYDYRVEIEYPEYQPLTDKKELKALMELKELLNSRPIALTSLGVSSKEGLLDVSFVPLVYREGKYMRINSFKLSLKKSLKKKRSLNDNPSARYAETSVLSSGKWVKIRVKDTGVYQILHSELSGMGFSDPSKVRLYGYGGYLLPEDFRLPKVDDLQEVPLWRESNYVLFYANGTIRWEKDKEGYKHTQNYCSSYSYYFLTESSEAPLSFASVASLPDEGGVTVTSFPAYSLYEKELFAWYHAGRMLFDDYDYKSGDTKTYTLDTPGLIEGKSLTVSFSASHTNNTYLDITVNGNKCDRLSIPSNASYSKASVSEGTFSWPSGSASEKTSVTLRHERPSTVSGHLDFIRLNYLRRLALNGSFTCFRMNKEQKSKFVVGNAHENMHVWNVTDVINYYEITGNLLGGNFTFIENTSSEGSEYVAVDVRGSFPKVEVVGSVANQNLHSLRDIDMIIITPPNAGMLFQAERLAEYHRQKDSLMVEVVTSEQIYNEFSSGTPDVSAYRWLMKMLYDRSGSGIREPKYLLLFGDGAWDNRMLSASWRKYNPKDFLLCYESVNSVSETNSYVLEEYFGLLDDMEGLSHTRDKIDVGVGRFPARTVLQAQQMVDKTINYMNNKYAGAWKNIVCLLGDDEEGSPHLRDAETIAGGVLESKADVLIKKFYWDAYKLETSASGNSYPDARRDIFSQLKTGALAVAYSGHANPETLSHEKVVTLADINSLDSPRLPLWLTMGCDAGPFDSAEESIGENLFLNHKGGAIASFTSARTTYSGSNGELAKYFLKYALSKDESGNSYRLGDAFRLAKNEVYASTNKLQYVLLGDPALSLSSYRHKVVIDEFNDKSEEEQTLVKAGGIVSVKGRIVDNEGNTAEDFNGIIYPTVKDNMEELRTQGNSSVDPYAYKARVKTLYSGSDSIRGGQFSFSFPVPLDINYSMESGLLNLYALDNSREKEAHGSFENFLVGGTEEGAMQTDSLGPKISMYLNMPDFVYGGDVNETPMLVVHLEDKDGINMTGNGIGHDLLASIDNSDLYTYVLNDYYIPDAGGYTSGSIRYSLPELPEGKHTLLFRAWDIKNNSSVSELEFNVKYGLKPGLFNVDCTQSPAYNHTTFIISHDRPESELDISVAVYDFSGRELWVHAERGVSEGNYYYIDWDLTSNGGQRLSPGVYLFRASISAGGSKESTKTRKIVILAQ